MKAWMMKWIIMVILVVMTAVLLPQTVASDQLDSGGFSGLGGYIFPPDSDAKKMENKIAEALASFKPAINPALNSSNSDIGPINNISHQNDSSNDTSQNSSLDNSTVNSKEHAQSNPREIMADNSSSSQNAGASTKGRFKGFYGMSATRHEIGKSGIDSSMFLSGKFEMEKNVKFHDQGIE